MTSTLPAGQGARPRQPGRAEMEWVCLGQCGPAGARRENAARTDAVPGLRRSTAAPHFLSKTLPTPTHTTATNLPNHPQPPTTKTTMRLSAFALFAAAAIAGAHAAEVSFFEWENCCCVPFFLQNHPTQAAFHSRPPLPTITTTRRSTPPKPTTWPTSGPSSTAGSGTAPPGRRRRRKARWSRSPTPSPSG